MKKRIWLIASVAAGCVMLCTSCLDIPRQPQVITNKIGIKKVELPSDLIAKISVSEFPDLNGRLFDDDFCKSVFGTVFLAHTEMVSLSDGPRHLAFSTWGNFIVVKGAYSRQKIVKKLYPKGRVWGVLSFVVKFGADEYWAIAVHQRRNASALFILDKQLNVVYEEHDFLHCFEAGKVNDELHGEGIVLKIGNFHPYNVKGNEKYYMYYLPGKDR